MSRGLGLTAAMHAALAIPSDLEPLRQIAAHHKLGNWLTARQALLAHILLAGIDRAHLGGRIDSGAPAVVFTLLSGGADLDDFRLVTMEPAFTPEIPRSAEWAAAAERLAAWADAQATP